MFRKWGCRPKVVGLGYCGETINTIWGTNVAGFSGRLPQETPRQPHENLMIPYKIPQSRSENPIKPSTKIEKNHKPVKTI